MILVHYGNYWDKQDANFVSDYLVIYETSAKSKKNLEGHYPNHDVSGCAFTAEPQCMGTLLWVSYVPVKLVTGFINLSKVHPR